MSIPVILLAGGLETVGLFRQPQEIDWPAMIFGTLLSGLSAYLCIHYFLVLIKKIGMQPFVVYRVVSRGIRGLVALVFHFQEQDGLRALLAGCLGVVLFGYAGCSENDRPLESPVLWKGLFSVAFIS